MVDEEEEKEKEEVIKCKVILIGSSGVGKTSIILKFIKNIFKSDMVSSAGASFYSKTLIMDDKNQSIKFEIWDTAGQEKFRSLNRAFYRKSNACILVYDITKRSSFEDLKDFWINEIKENAPENISR